MHLGHGPIKRERPRKALASFVDGYLAQLSTVIFVFLVFAYQQGRTQDYIIYPDSSAREVKLLHSKSSDLINFMENGRHIQIDRSLLFLIIEKKNVYTVTSVGTNRKSTRGILYTINDSSVELIILNSAKDKINIARIPIEEIQTIELKRHGAKGAAIGVISGFVLGVTIGLIVGDTPGNRYLNTSPHTAAENAILVGLGLGLHGALIGALVGSSKTRIPINGSIENFKKNKTKLSKYAMQ